MSVPRSIVLLGATGTGKTPLGALIERRGLWGSRARHFDFGEHLRRIALQGHWPGLCDADVGVIEAALGGGALLEDEHFHIAATILRGFIASAAAEDLIVLNGLPRHAGQARDVAAIVDVRAVIVLSCRAEVVLQRIAADIGGDRAGRLDDGASAVAAKLEIYRVRTAALVEYYRAGGARIISVEVGAETTADLMWQEIDRSGGFYGVRQP
ncbi:MAG: nucleoside monophosphate kinase [Planctomycetaceae bacterium]|nr:nucleoside monophosphate kinase [Planctomycetaceae bacterium]